VGGAVGGAVVWALEEYASLALSSVEQVSEGELAELAGRRLGEGELCLAPGELSLALGESSRRSGSG
tara:strand:+ start:1394 stop:1594 length:201 start_codon:yes stop_codon:yes gene_type:complete